MAISLIPLPYTEKALEPHISEKTLKTHHGAHHKGYVDKVNEGVEGTELADADLETIVRTSHRKGDGKLFNSAGQAWNHGFYWHSLTPERTAPGKGLAEAINRDFGSVDKLKQALSEEADEHFASGWAWLVANKGKLEVISTHDAETTITEDVIPLLTIDVWEHAYYLDVKNHRPDYVKAVVENCLNWKFASENYDRGSPWTYPSRVLAHEVG